MLVLKYLIRPINYFDLLIFSVFNRQSFSVDFSGSSTSLLPTKSKKIIVQFDETLVTSKISDPICQLSLVRKVWL